MMPVPLKPQEMGPEHFPQEDDDALFLSLLFFSLFFIFIYLVL